LCGYGCSKCSKTYSYTNDEYIEKVKEKHGNKYNYSKTNYTKAKEKISITCNEHGDFLQEAYSHLIGFGCSKCTNKYSPTTEEYIEKANEKHKYKYDYSNTEYLSVNEKITVICKKHGKFEQHAGNHLRGSGCQKCCNKYSKKSIQYLNFISTLKNIKIQHAENEFEFLIKNTKYKADGYCQETNTVYEFHGDYWHGNPKIFQAEEFNKTTKCFFGELYHKTLEREELIKKLGYKLIVMWEQDWNNINRSIQILQRKFRFRH
jgi:G:T-mismatch repair DNA endonuclease (very short patch repair protein)